MSNLYPWTTGKAGNTAPRGQVPTPPRRTYRLSGREALSNRGVGAKEAPPQARTRLTRAGIQTAGKTADRPHNGTAGVSSRVTSVAGADGFSVNPTTKLEASNWFRFHTAAQRWAAGMEAETPPLTGSDHVLPLVVAGTGAAMVWFVRKPNKRAAIVAGAVVIGITVSRFPAGYFPYCASPAGGASAWCWRPLLLHRAREPRGLTRSSKPDPPLGSNCCGPLPSGRRPFFFPSAPAPRGDPGKSR